MNNVNSRYIDLTPLKQDTLGNIEVYKMLIELFIVGIDEYIHTMNSEIKTNNWEALFQVAHKILPNIRMFGIKDLDPIIYELETDLRDRNNIENIHRNIDYSLDIFKHVKNELQTELKLINDTEI